MKIFTLLVTLLFAFTITGRSQGFGGTPPNCTLPAGYILNPGDRIVTYQNPLKGCTDDCGILTAGAGNNPGNIVFPSQIPSATLSKTFNIFVFDADLKCSSEKGFACQTFVTLYIVHSSYNSAVVPADADKYGESQPFLLNAHGALNHVSVSFNKAYDVNEQYRIFLDFGKGNSCAQQNDKYIFDLIPEDGPLPVSISSFLVGRSGNSVLLNWKTEIEMSGNFNVQRSYDNVSYQTIATVPGSANGSTKNYTYVDNTNTSKSMSFYRLKVVKQSGEISYSDIKTVKGILGKMEFVIFPNPSVGNARITISDLSEPTRVQVLDNSGRLIKSLMLNNTNSIELNGLVKGSYLVKIIGSVSGNAEVTKLTVIN